MSIATFGLDEKKELYLGAFDGMIYKFMKTSPTAVVDNFASPTGFTLSQNFPNPFNPSTTIEFAVGTNGHASLRVFNVLGQEVAMLFDDVAQAGRVYPVKFDASHLPSGLYFAKLEAGKQQLKRKMMFVK